MEDAARRIAHVRIADAVSGEEGASIAGEVGRVDADERDPVSIALEGRLEARGLLLARMAPGGPEVDDDDLPAQRREAQGAVAVQPFQVEVHRHRVLPSVELLRDAVPVVLDDLPDEEPEQQRDEPERADLACELEPGHQAPTMNTVVPMSTVLNSHSASAMYIRMHPCETE